MVRHPRTLAASGIAALLLLLSSCELDPTSAAEQPVGLVVHAVLNPGSDYYTILVEQSLGGRVTLDTTQQLDPVEPILSSGGIPVSQATVRITRLGNNESATGKEDADYRSDHRGHGVYRFRNVAKGGLAVPDSVRNYLEILRGGGYALRVEWRGIVVTGRTTIPTPTRGVPQVQGRPIFNRDHDSLIVNFPRADDAARTVLRVATPYGPFSLFSDSARIVVPGRLRNPFATGFPSAFVPGFQSSVVLAAVDTNYFDYYRTVNSPFTGTGLITHLQGGSGLFGSFLPLDERRLDITADYVDPLDGRYAGGASGRDTLELWVDDAVNGGRLVSGSLRTVSSGGLTLRRAPVIGALANGELSLRVFPTDDAAGYSGTARVSGTTLSFDTPFGSRTFTRVPR